jgi:hypothetical protein
VHWVIRPMSCVLCPVSFEVPTPAEYADSVLFSLQHEAKELKLYDQSGRVFIHPSSILFSEAGFKSGFLAYFAKAETSKVFLRDATEVSPSVSESASVTSGLIIPQPHLNHLPPSHLLLPLVRPFSPFRPFPFLTRSSCAYALRSWTAGS